MASAAVSPKRRRRCRSVHDHCRAQRPDAEPVRGRRERVPPGAEDDEVGVSGELQQLVVGVALDELVGDRALLALAGPFGGGVEDRGVINANDAVTRTGPNSIG